jgi:glycosyltransferase involved in cell wall biosynthesis
MKTLNEGVKLARGKYLARHDADDLSAPERLARQVARLDADDGLGMIGSNYIIIDEAGKPVGSTQVFTHHSDLAVAEPVSNQFGHGSVMVRTKLIRRLKGYNEKVGFVEDYDLWSRIAQVARIANTKESLYYWRRNYEGISMSNVDLQQTQAFAVRDKYFDDILKHPKKYRLLSSWHPLSFNAGIRAYHQKKSLLQRDLAYLYLKNGRPVRARRSLFMAVLYSPWQKRGIKELLLSMTNKDMEKVLTYEYL